MHFENGPSKEDPKVRITREQFDEIRNVYVPDLSDSELDEFIGKIDGLGIKLDSGEISIVIDGEPAKITTSREDFGTIVLDPDADVIPSGF